MYLGIDEAGKGPVLGPMVAAAVLADPASLPADVDDSKRFTPARRETLDDAIRGIDDVAVGVAFVDPAEIDRPDTDMNTLTVRGQARAARIVLARSVAAGLDEPIRVVADAGDTSEERFARRLESFIPDGRDDDRRGNAAAATAATGETNAVPDFPAVDVEAAHGADEDDLVVGAASIVAKVARDARIATIDSEYPEYAEIGSGYPSDSATRSFLRAYVADHGEVPDCARRSWSTCDDVLAAAAQSGLDEF